MTRWVAFIQLFSLYLVHKPGTTFTIPDGLSRRPKNLEEEDPNSPEFDEEEDWIKPHPGFGARNVNSLNFSGIQVPTKQEGFWKRMQEYLSKMKKPQSSKDEEFRRIKRRWENETYKSIKARFWWEGMKKSVKKWVQAFLAFQKRSQNLKREQGKFTATSTLFERVSMDAVHIKSGRWKYMIVARDDFSGWPETVGLVKLTAKAVAEWICRYGSPKELTVDGGTEFGK
ncbi:hypothetical protein O181_084638 [Austropuccinia psidii MF-1]|uniref:Integrase zinc-binding domain-containing protein n=1 Tax=Austropuccinia psidii MF-1 TaxID=1389203 RepID=A0A9Q3FRP6_9BASI|nr:hypothetical protein [Austropuccinia psidii MF-1]